MAESERDLWWRVAGGTIGSVATASFRIRVSGQEHIPRRGGALLAYNHVSVIDAIFVAMPILRRDRIIRCFALSEDFERPMMGRALHGLRQIPIRRGAGAWDPLEEMAARIREGWLCGIAPEGTVGIGDELLPIQKGPARIALLAGCPVIPVGLWGPQRRYPKSGLHFRAPARPPLGVAFGPPIQAEGDAKHRPDVQSLTDQLGEALEAQVEVARRLAPSPV
jgi:1-acyl-sn-glycerol-3-phosphate acyltransferase